MSRARPIISLACLSLLLVLVLLPPQTVLASLIGDDKYPYASDGPCNSSGCGTDEWGFSKRTCTSYVAWRLVMTNGLSLSEAHALFDPMRGDGNADRWKDHALGRGYSVNTTPAVGAIAYWTDFKGGAGSAGHVAWVRAVAGDLVTIDEYNFLNQLSSNERSYRNRTDDAHGRDVLYLHIKDMSGPFGVRPALYRAHIDLLQTPDSITSGAQASVTVGITNASASTWPASVSASYHWLRPDGSVEVWDGLRGGIPQLGPDGFVQMVMLVNGPPKAGPHVLEIDLVDEGKTWFKAQGSPTKTWTTTVAPPARPTRYAASIDLLVPPSLVVTNARTAATVRITNTSATTWPLSVFASYHWLRLDGTAEVWEGIRGAIPQLGPDGSVQLVMLIDGPPTRGPHVLEFDLVDEGTTWFKSQGSSTRTWSTSVVPDLYGAQIDLLVAPPEIPAGSRTSATVKIINTSSTTWPAEIRVSYHWRTLDGVIVVWDGIRGGMPTMPPGGSVQMVILVDAPAVPGTYVLEIDLVYEGRTWFAAEGNSSASAPVDVSLSVVSPTPTLPSPTPPPSPSVTASPTISPTPTAAPTPRPASLRLVSVSFTPTSLTVGGALHVRVVVHNDGDIAATTSGPAPGTSFPEAVHRPDDTCGAWHVGVDYDGDPDQNNFGDHRWRWGFGSAVAAGSDGIAEGDIVTATAGTRGYFVGLLQDCVGWAPFRDAATATLVNVH